MLICAGTSAHMARDSKLCSRKSHVYLLFSWRGKLAVLCLFLSPPPFSELPPSKLQAILAQDGLLEIVVVSVVTLEL